MFNPNRYENTRPDGVPVLEVLPPDDAAGRTPRLFVPLKRSELRGDVVGPLASLRLLQTFGYTRSQLDRTIEALYRFPLPGDAAVTFVSVRFGDVEIIAELKERAQAESDYEDAKRQGQQSALATRESASVFTLRVAGLQPDEDVVVETHYVQLARAEGPGWSLRLPLTTAPRYVREDEIGSRPAAGQPLALLRDPGHRFALDLLVHGARDVTSPTHALDVVPAREEDQPVADEPRPEGDLRVRLRDGQVLPDRDCVLVWAPIQPPERAGLLVYTHNDTAAGWTYFLALVTPPGAEPPPSAPREVTLLVDHSGSMYGAKWEAADWGVARFLNDLTDRDAFALGLFHTTTAWLARQMRPAAPANIQQAIQYLKDNRESGGTNLGVALEQALDIRPLTGEHARHVLLVTDAQVSDEGRIRRLVDEEARRRQRRRISVLCIDAAPNSLLALDIAERGGGVARFLTSSPTEGDISTALDEVLADWAAPIYVDLRLRINRTGVQAIARMTLKDPLSGWQAVDLGDLPTGRAVWVVGRVPLDTNGPLSFELQTGAQQLADCPTPIDAGEASKALKALFGARRVLGLEFLMRAGHTGDALLAELARQGYRTDDLELGGRQHVYAENAQHASSAALKDLLVREALDYGLASSETAFVAVRTEQGERVSGTVVVANALPSGWSDEFRSSSAPLTFRSILTSSRRHFRASTSELLGRGLATPSPRIRASRGGAETTSETGSGPALAPVVLYADTPTFRQGEAALFDSTRDADRARWQAGWTIRSLRIKLDGTIEDHARLANLALLLYVGDLAVPAARIALRDVLLQDGRRPLNLASRAGDELRVVLVDPDGVWSAQAPRLTVSIGP